MGKYKYLFHSILIYTNTIYKKVISIFELKMQITWIVFDFKIQKKSNVFFIQCSLLRQYISCTKTSKNWRRKKNSVP